jgi:SAM-dependent methyltransferase
MPKMRGLIARLTPLVPPVLLGMLVGKGGPDLTGDRDVEWSWVVANIQDGPGEVLDFGPGASPLGLAAAMRGYTVTAIDMGPVKRYYVHEKIQFIQGDLLKEALPEGHYDLVEHVGLTGRYGVTENQPDGDLEAMARLKTLLKPGGTMLLTIPAGRDAVYAPWHRVYGQERLPRLTAGYNIVREAYYIKDGQNLWREGARGEALDYRARAGAWNPRRNVYALACLVLRNV